MLKSINTTPQLQMFNGLGDQIDQQHPLFKLSNVVNWSVFHESFKKHYSEKMGAPSKPIRLMVSLLILKYLRNLSDENLVIEWSENVYFQYFSGEQFFRPCLPCVASELVAFRQRIGEEGMELILKESIRINEPPDTNSGKIIVSVDTTVQEKNITYPTDDKLYKRIIKKCWRIAEDEGIDLRQSYKRVLKELSHYQRFRNSKKGAKAARKADKKVKIIAGRLFREICRKLCPDCIEQYKSIIAIFEKALQQKRGDRDKIYSLHEPDVKCYSKGKEHKKFEFGSKASIVVDQQSGIIMGALNFSQTIHDSKTIPDVLEQFERINGIEPNEVYADRGYRGIAKYKNAEILTPKPKKNISKEQRARHSKRASIEPVIGHLKKDYRLCRNYLKGVEGDKINVLLAAAAMNFKRRMNLWRSEALRRWLLILKAIFDIYWKWFVPKLKLTF
jgi:transposase, IS5 family